MFGTGGLQAAGFTHDIIALPGNAGAAPGQQVHHSGSWGYPSTSSNGEADWIDVEIIPTAASSYRFMDGQNGRPGNGPTTPVSYTQGNGMVVGITFEPLQGGCWFEGYWYWVCPSGGLQQQQKFALWQLTAGGQGTLVPNSTVTSSGSLRSGWNYIPLPTPVPLAVSTTYVAATGVNGNFSDSDTLGMGTGAADSFGTGGHTAGIHNGPIFAFSDFGGGGIAPNSFGTPQGVFTTGGTDPSAIMPGGGSNSANFWVDVQVTTTPPYGYKGSFRAWPNNFGASPFTSGDSSVNYIIGTEMHLSVPCTLNKIWYYSPSGTTQLVTECAVWSIDTEAKVAENASPSWFKPDGSAGVAGSGWLYCTVSNTTLPAGRYRVTVYNDAASPDSWGAKHVYYFNVGDAAANIPGQGFSNNGPTWYGIKNGPLYVPSLSNASAANYYNGTPDLGGSGPGQAVFAVGPPNTYPNLYVKGLGQTYWIDMEVTPLGVNSNVMTTFLL